MECREACQAWAAWTTNVSTEPQKRSVPLIDRLLSPDSNAVKHLEENLNTRRSALTALRAYHEYSQMPLVAQDPAIKREMRHIVNERSHGALDTVNVSKVQFDENRFIPKHRREFDPGSELRGFIVSLRVESEDGLLVVLIDSGSQELYRSANDAQRGKIAETAFFVTGSSRLAFVTDEGREGYRVENYFMLPR